MTKPKTEAIPRPKSSAYTATYKPPITGKNNFRKNNTGMNLSVLNTGQQNPVRAVNKTRYSTPNLACF